MLPRLALPRLSRQPRVGLALGSGAARGWAHVGVIRALERLGIRPQVVCGASIGALIGAVYAGGRLAELAAQAEGFTRLGTLRYLDWGLRHGGLIEGRRLMAYLNDYLSHEPIESLPVRYGAVATDYATGEEVWLREGPVRDAVRASIAMPGLFAPQRHSGRWLIDGGLVNPVPVSLCRALGAEVVIAVRLSARPPRHHISAAARAAAEPPAPPRTGRSAMRRLLAEADDTPGMMDVLAEAIRIMGDQVTACRDAEHPAEVTLDPQVGHVELLRFDRARDCYPEGEEAVNRREAALRRAVQPRWRLSLPAPGSAPRN